MLNMVYPACLCIWLWRWRESGLFFFKYCFVNMSSWKRVMYFYLCCLYEIYWYYRRNSNQHKYDINCSINHEKRIGDAWIIYIEKKRLHKHCCARMHVMYENFYARNTCIMGMERDFRTRGRPCVFSGKSCFFSGAEVLLNFRMF